MAGTLQDPGGRGYVCGWCLTMWPTDVDAQRCYTQHPPMVPGRGAAPTRAGFVVDPGPLVPWWAHALLAAAAVAMVIFGIVLAGRS